MVFYTKFKRFPVIFGFLSVIFTSQIALSAIIVRDINGQEKIDFLLGETLNIEVSELDPFSLVRLKVSSNNHRSENTYRALANGTVDISKQAPVMGYYSGVDPEGPLWSMLPLNSPNSTPSFDLYIEVENDRTVLFQKNISRKLRRATTPIKEFEISKSGFTGRLFLPEGQGPFPGLVVLGGGEGGLNGSSFSAAHYSTLGYASLAVAYFGLPGLPAGVDRVPIEYFINAIEALKSEPLVNSSKIGIMGGSRGGEAALAVASKVSGLAAVISNMGNPIPMSGYDFVTNQEISPWTYEGKEFPFVSNLVFGNESFRTHPDGVIAFEFFSTRDWQHLEHPIEELNGLIDMQNIQAPVLFLGAGDDRLWPSSKLMSIAYETLKQNNSRSYADEFFNDPDAGHILGGIPGLPHPYTYFLFPTQNGVEFWEYGGHIEANVKARRDSYKKIKNFLDKHLNQ